MLSHRNTISTVSPGVSLISFGDFAPPPHPPFAAIDIAFPSTLYVERRTARRYSFPISIIITIFCIAFKGCHFSPLLPGVGM